MTDLTTVKTEPRRDRWGRPYVTPPGGGKEKTYTRCTTYVDCIEDKFNIQQWEKRMVAKGLTLRDDLHLAVAATDLSDKRKLDALCKEAKEAAKGSAKATTGTALHSLTEYVDRGEDLPAIPPAATRALDAYRKAMAPFDIVAIEQFCVLDELEVAGTPDRIVRFDGQNYIADLKTGNIDFGQIKMAMQLAIYSRSQAYDIETGTRTPLPDVYQNAGIIIHLDPDTAECTLHWINIGIGWQAVQTATQVRQWRNVSGLLAPFQPASSSEVA